MENILQRFASRLQNIADPLEKLKEFVQIYFLLIEEDKNLAEVFQVELRQSGKFLKNYHNQKFMDLLNLIAGILEDGMARGFFRKTLNIDIAKIMVFGALDEVARQWILGADAKYSLQEAGGQTTQNLIAGLMAG